jgi:hypothetical protein
MTSIWGEVHDKKIADFYKKVESIEIKHFGVFKKQINELTGQYPYTLTNYFFIQWDRGKYELIFCDEIYIPLKVKHELKAKFTDIFHQCKVINK